MVACSRGCWGKGNLILFFSFCFFFLYFSFFLFVFRLFSLSLVCFFLVLVSVFVPRFLLSLFVFSFYFFVSFFHPFSLFFFLFCYPTHLLVREVFIRGRGRESYPTPVHAEGVRWQGCYCAVASGLPARLVPLFFSSQW